MSLGAGALLLAYVLLGVMHLSGLLSLASVAVFVRDVLVASVTITEPTSSAAKQE